MELTITFKTGEEDIKHFYKVTYFKTSKGNLIIYGINLQNKDKIHSIPLNQVLRINQLT